MAFPIKGHQSIELDPLHGSRVEISLSFKSQLYVKIKANMCIATQAPGIHKYLHIEKKKKKKKQEKKTAHGLRKEIDQMSHTTSSNIGLESK